MAGCWNWLILLLHDLGTLDELLRSWPRLFESAVGQAGQFVPHDTMPGVPVCALLWSCLRWCCTLCTCVLPPWKVYVTPWQRVGHPWAVTVVQPQVLEHLAILALICPVLWSQWLTVKYMTGNLYMTRERKLNMRGATCWQHPKMGVLAVLFKFYISQMKMLLIEKQQLAPGPSESN